MRRLNVTSHGIECAVIKREVGFADHLSLQGCHTMTTHIVPLALAVPIALSLTAQVAHGQADSGKVTETRYGPETHWTYRYSTWDAGTSSVTWYPAYTSTWPTYGS